MFDNAKVISRRFFLSKSVATASSFSLAIALSGIKSSASSAFTKAEQKVKLDLSSLQAEFQGKLITPQDSNFDEIVFGKLWNELHPDRIPQLVAQVNNEQDIAAAIKYAAANKLKVSVRGGGHNWYNLSNRHGGILIDLANLNRIISIDPDARTAIVQPIVSNREIQAALKPYNLAFPTGHCPPVKVSGYLLSGGMSWNQGTWGPAVASVEAIELVTAEGKIITANKDQNQDYFWAARGAGPGLFAVATRYHLNLYPLPKAIASSLYYYAYDDMESVVKWLDTIASKLPNNVELSFGISTAPPELLSKVQSSNGKLCTVAATVFADNQNEIHTALSALESCPVIDKCLSKSIEQPTDFDGLFDASGALWPSGLRNCADAMFYNCNLGDLVRAVKNHFLACPSQKSLIMISIFTGTNISSAPLDAAFSMQGKLYGGPWTMWNNAQADNDNKQWHDKCAKLLVPHADGHYIGETDIVDHTNYAKASYKKANWQRLAELRKKHDPNGLFFNFDEALT